MKRLLIAFGIFAALTSCAQSQRFRFPSAESKKPANEAVATFAEGLFLAYGAGVPEPGWRSRCGIRICRRQNKKPDYEEVSSGETGHAEAVQVFYDPSLISYETLVKAFFASQDPTTLNRQGNDVGTQYRSMAFYRNADEKAIIEKEIKRLTDAKTYRGKIVTEVVPYVSFFNAEDYHQEYIARHQDNPYVANVSIPDYWEFRKSFKGNFKL